jgi:flagellin
MIIQHNMLSNFTNRQLGINNLNKGKASEKLGSGYRINRAADDSAGLSISEKMRAQIRGLNRAEDNIQDGISLLQTADGAMNEIHAVLQRMRELSVQAANDTYTDEDRDCIQEEYNALKKEINRISRQTEFNTQKIIFDNTVTVGGIPSDIKIYTTDTGEYGGIIYQGVRYDWSKFLSETGGNSLDSAIPKEGAYFLDTVGGTRLYFTMDEGMNLPHISKRYEINATMSSIQIDNSSYSWNHVKDEDGYAINLSNPKEGQYSFSHYGSIISFYIEDGDNIGDVIEKLNASGTDKLRSWSSQTIIEDLQQAIYGFNVETPEISINNSNRDNILEPSYAIQADLAGIQLNGYTKVAWEDLNFSPPFYNGDTKGVNFTSGKGIGAETTVTFQCPETGVSFSFHISSEASMIEVIKGLNNTMVPTQIDANVQAQFTMDSSGSSVMTGATVCSYPDTDISYKFQRDKIGLDFDMDNWVTANSLSGLKINFGSNSFVLIPSELSKLDQFFRDGNSNNLKLAFQYSDTEKITIDFSRTNNMSDNTRPDPSAFVNQADYQNAMNSYVEAKIADFTAQFSNSSLDIKSDNASLTIGKITGKGIDSGNKTNTFYFGVKPKEEDPLYIQAGANSFQQIAMYIGKISTAKLGISSEGVRTSSLAGSNITTMDSAIGLVSKYRSQVGAYQNQLEHAKNNVSNTSENMQRSESKIRDADMAKEMIHYAKQNILEQVSQSMLSQANQSPQGILNLIR